MRKKSKSKGLKIAVAAMFIAVLGLGCVSLIGCGNGSDTPTEPEVIINPITGEEAPDGLNARPVQVSIPNAPDGAVPQSNLTYADIIYEIPVEADLTRLQAIFYSEFPDKIGPIRSVRYYFVDIAREYKACHVGYGWGKTAQKYMIESKVPHINGMQDTDLFYRSSEKSAPNNAYIDWSSIEERAQQDGWFEEQKKIKPFKFRDKQWREDMKVKKAEAKETIEKLKDSDDPEDQKKVAKAEALLKDPVKATSIKVSSSGCNSNCEYNEETKKYDRYWYGEEYIDKETGEQLSFDNILVQKVKSSIMTDPDTGAADPKGRIKIDFNSSGEAYLFTKGQVIKGTWSKKDADSRTIFKDENGRQFRFSKGKTWVYVVDQKLNFDYE